MPRGPAGTCDHLGNLNGSVPGIVWTFLFGFLAHQAFLCGSCARGAQRKQGKPQSRTPSLSSLPKAETFPRRSWGPFPCLREPGHLCRRPSSGGWFDFPPPHGTVPAQLADCNRLDQETASSDHSGAERNKWLKQASWPLGSHTLLFQPPDMCFSGNTGNHLCPLRKGRVFSACV